MNIRGGRKLSFTTWFILSVALALLIYVPVSAYRTFHDGVSALELERDQRMPQTMFVAKTLIATKNSDALTTWLREARIANDLDYFVVYRNGLQIHAEPGDNLLATGNSYQERREVLGRHLLDQHRSELSQDIGSGTVLTIGRARKLEHSMGSVIFGTSVWKKILVNYLAIILAAWLAVWAHTRELRRLVKNIEATGRVY